MTNARMRAVERLRDQGFSMANAVIATAHVDSPTVRPSVVLRRLADQVRNDGERGYFLHLAWELEACAPLTRRLAFDDLNEAGYFHAQPCSCAKCTLAVVA